MTTERLNQVPARRTPHGHTPAAFGAVVLAAVAAGIVAVGLATFGVAFAVGGEDATSDNWVGILTVLALAVGLAGSLPALGLAVVARLRHETWSWLWLPLLLAPGLLTFLVLGEALWWE